MSERRKKNDRKVKIPKQFPWFQKFLCEGCGECVKACQTNALAMVGVNLEIPYAWVVNVDKCIGCGKCAEVCLIGAVQMTRYVNKAIKRYKNARSI